MKHALIVLILFPVGTFAWGLDGVGLGINPAHPMNMMNPMNPYYGNRWKKKQPQEVSPTVVIQKKAKAHGDNQDTRP